MQPPPSRFALVAAEPGDGELVAVGGDLEPGTLLEAYRAGLFPMRVQRRGRLGWWAPDPRAILPFDGLIVSRSLRRSVRRYEVRVDTAFEAVMLGCADPRRPHGWIDASFVAAYTRLHALGWAHSIETWRVADDGSAELVGGLYGVAIGGFFAAESKFHRATDASKVAVVALVERLRAAGATLLDVQWLTPHLASLGTVELARAEYLERLGAACAGELDGPVPW